MLLQIRDYISQERMVSTQQLMRAFKLDYPALEPMLALWIKKGVIAKQVNAPTCTSPCFKCRVPVEYYQIIYNVH